MNRSWNILCWNIRGINSQDKWDALHNKIDESSCVVLCLQETKREYFDMSYIRNFAPRRLDKYDFVPSTGFSGSILVVWATDVFDGLVLEEHQFAITLSFTSAYTLETWKLSTVYGPCVEPAMGAFIAWLRNLQISNTDNWIILGDFNFYRSTENRNRPGGNISDTFIFNDAIGESGLIELPLKGEPSHGVICSKTLSWSNLTGFFYFC